MPTVQGSAIVDGQTLTAQVDYSIAPPVTVEFADFTANAQTAGLILPTVVTAAGMTYRMTPKTSTKGPAVAALAAGATNQFSLLVVGGNDAAHRLAGIDIGGIVLAGTDQGHLYNGMRVQYSTAAHIHDGAITAIPGDSGSPPGETFSINLWHADGALVEHLAIDGQGIAASLYGLNNSIGVTVRNSSGHNNRAGTCLTSWKCGGVLVQDFDASHCVRPFNIEQPAGNHRYERCDMRASANRPHLTCNSNERSVKLVVVDPIVDAFPLRVGVSSQPYMGKPQLQKVADVSLIIAGKDVSTDTSKLLCGDVW